MKHKKGGFTLVEIIVSLTLICIIAIAMIPAFAAQLKMTIDTKNITTATFEAQGEVERMIMELKGALIDPVEDELTLPGVTSTTKTIFGRTVTMYRLEQDFPSNAIKDFIVFLSKKLAEMEVRQLLVATGVTIEVSNETVHKVADLKKTPKPTLIGRFDVNSDPNWYANLYKWYVSKEGDPDPVFPDDYERIVFAGVTPSTLTDLSKLANKYVVFTVTPVDIHGVRGNEVRSNNTIYVLGEEWRAGSFAWIDKNEDVTYAAATDVKIEKTLTWTSTWPLVKIFDSNNEFVDPAYPDDGDLLDPSMGSLYVPMNIGRSPSDTVGPIEIGGANVLSWIVDKGINLATDITVSNSSDIYMKARDGNIVLYQYIELDPITGDAVFEADGMPSLINYGPSLSAPYGEITFETGSRGDVILQNYSTLDSGSDISLTPFGHVSIYQASLSANGSILLDTTKGSTYPGNRDIIIQDSLLTLDASGTADRSVTIETLNALNISNTIFNGNTGALSKVVMTAADGIILADTSFNDSTVKINSNIEMSGGGWDGDSSITIEENRVMVIAASGSKVANSGSLVLGNTAGITFARSMDEDLANPLVINLGKGANHDEVVISTNYGRNVGYADSSGAESIETLGDYQSLGSGSTNLEYTAVKNSGSGSADLSCAFDGNNMITVYADGTGPISAYYTLNVRDKYAEDVTGSIVLRVTADEGEAPVVEVIGSSIPTFTVTFDKNGGAEDADPSALEVRDGEAIGTLPEPPVYPGYSFAGWNTMPNGSGSDVTAATVITDHITVYARYTLIPVYTVTFHSNGGTVDADPRTLSVPHGSPIDIMPTPPRRTGYWFQNWSTLPSGGSLVNAETIVWGDMTAYAQWTLKKTFADISNGDYISISDVSFQKVSADRLLARDWVPYSGYNTMNWSAAYNLATSYYTNFNTGSSWVLSSGLLDGGTLDSLRFYRNSILRIGYDWWGGSRSSNYAYLVDYRGRVQDDESKFYYNYCRPYITINTDGLYVTSGSGTADDPYVLEKE